MKMANKSAWLMTLFSVSAIMSMAVILGTVFIGIRTIYTQNVVEIAEQQSVSISEALFLQERSFLTGGHGDNADTLSILSEDFERIDKRMHDYLQPFNIVKIKVFNKQMEIVYSTDPSIVGKIDAGNERLEIALKGKVDTELLPKHKVIDLAEEELINIDVVETYVPVSNGAGDIIGSVEVYMDVTRYRYRLTEILSSSMILITLVLLGVFSLLFLVMRRGTSRLTEYERQLHEFATTDVLTGIANRRYLLNRAEEEFSRVQREWQSDKQIDSEGFILIDIDYFKNINDTHGHQVGDEVLREMAKRLKHCIRRFDTVGRYGGEEFLIITHKKDSKNVKIIAERILNEVRSRPFEVEGISIDVTVSIGLASIEQNDKSINDVIKRADESLYKAKASGRNQIVWLVFEEAI